MIPLREVMDEQYVVYFNTAGTAPVKPHNGYCPHSARLDGTAVDHSLEDEKEQDLVSTTGPPAPPVGALRPEPVVKSPHRGVAWAIDDGLMGPIHWS